MKEQLPSIKKWNDVSSAFSTMSQDDFRIHLRTLRNEKALYLVADWSDVATARRVKAFVEQGGPAGQKRTAAIRATREQKELEPNVFSSGVDWIQIK